MSVLEGKLVRTPSGIEGRVMAVGVAEYVVGEYGEMVKVIGFVGLLRTSDGTLTTVKLEGAEVVEQREPYEPPAPRTGPSEVRR